MQYSNPFPRQSTDSYASYVVDITSALCDCTNELFVHVYYAWIFTNHNLMRPPRPKPYKSGKRLEVREANFSFVINYGIVWRPRKWQRLCFYTMNLQSCVEDQKHFNLMQQEYYRRRRNSTLWYYNYLSILSV